MGFGRFVCVGVPFVLTLASLILILIAMLSGNVDRNIDMFEVKTQNLSISSSSLVNLVNAVKRDVVPVEVERSLPGDLIGSALNGNNDANFTASDFGLADSYRIYMWGYCSTTGSDTNCTKAKFDWASSALNITLINERAASASGTNATLPKDVTNALKTYRTASKWVQVVYIIAFILHALELIVGIFGFFSRAGSCATYIIAGLANFAIIAASALATGISLAVVLAVKSTSKAYGVKAALKTGFLSVTWLAVAFSLGASMFWLFSVCCCKNEHRKNFKGAGGEKFVPGPRSAYVPVGDSAYHGQQTGYAMGGLGTQAPVKTGAYEPYSHTNV